MPKFRDLGINAIPLTMQPPEIGDGGGDARKQHGGCGAAPNTTDYDDHTCASPNTTDRDDDHDDDHDDDCDAQCTTDVNCSARREHEKSPAGGKSTASAFSPEQVAQLRQQIDARINDQL